MFPNILYKFTQKKLGLFYRETSNRPPSRKKKKKTQSKPERNPKGKEQINDRSHTYIFIIEPLNGLKKDTCNRLTKIENHNIIAKGYHCNIKR